MWCHGPLGDGRACGGSVTGVARTAGDRGVLVNEPVGWVGSAGGLDLPGASMPATVVKVRLSMAGLGVDCNWWRD